MSAFDSTRWSLIRKAAQGLAPDRDDFARVYEPVARAYLAARWGGRPMVSEIDDAVQEVFLQCFKDGGALTRAEAGRPGGFRAFFRGIVRNVALHMERSGARRIARPGPAEDRLEEVPADETGLSTTFDRAWAEAILREAGRHHRERAEEAGGDALRRLELIRLRHEEGHPIRDIAAEWRVDAAHLHSEYSKAKREFLAALKSVVALHLKAADADVEAECRRIYETLR